MLSSLWYVECRCNFQFGGGTGWPDFVSLDKLNNTACRYLASDNLKLRVHLEVGCELSLSSHHAFATISVCMCAFYNHILLKNLPLIQYSGKVNFMKEACVCFRSPMQLGCIVKCVLHTLTSDDVSFIHCVCLALAHATDTFFHNPTWEEVVDLARKKSWHGYDYHNEYRHPPCSHDHLG